jgi:hypothetical protein
MRTFGQSVFAGSSDRVDMGHCPRPNCGRLLVGLVCIERDENDQKVRVCNPCSSKMAAERRARQPVGTLVNSAELDGAEVRIVKTFKSGKLQAQFVYGRAPYRFGDRITILQSQFAKKEQTT